VDDREVEGVATLFGGATWYRIHAAAFYDGRAILKGGNFLTKEKSVG
jgi:hypothetical protein